MGHLGKVQPEMSRFASNRGMMRVSNRSQDDNPRDSRDALRRPLIGRLGGFAATRFEVRGRRELATELPGTRVSRLDLSTADGTPVRALLTGPVGDWSGRPAILYIHAHGNRHDIGATELIAGRPALIAPPYAEALAQRGVVAMCIDLPCFGERAGDTEQEMAKRYLWQGRTLFGAMLSDLAGAIDVLAGVDGVDETRIGTFGISMGGTLAFWLGALDQRLKAVAHLCVFADLAHLVEHGGHDLHGLYMTVPGLLGVAHTGEIAGLVAPRPQFAAMGLMDPLTPTAAVERAVADVRSAYQVESAAANLNVHLSPETGHAETPAMRAQVLSFFERSL